LTLDYSPTVVLFTDHTEFNTVDHAAKLSGVWPFSKLTLGFSQDFALASSVVLGVADRVEHRSYNTLLTSRYEVSEKTSFEINGRQSITEYEQAGLINSKEWVSDNWFNYEFMPKLSLGAGLAVGYLDVEGFPSQLYERLSARTVYTATGKLDLNAAVGGEHRAYSGSGSDFYPVFSIGGVYRPTPILNISLNAFRQEQNSAYVAGQNYVSTGFTLTAQQTIFERFAITLTGSYYSLEYHTTSGGLATTRSDDVFSVRPGFDWVIRRNLRAGVFYSYRHNTSSDAFFEYSNNQVGLQVSWYF
jgi:hypothetical protein